MCMLQGVMQLPSSIVLLRYLSYLMHARVPDLVLNTWDAPFTAFFLYFILYAASTIMFQAVAFVCTARVYIMSTAAINVACAVMAIWCSAVQETGMWVLCIITAIFSSMWAPLYGYIFLDTNVSVSEVRCMIRNYCTIH